MNPIADSLYKNFKCGPNITTIFNGTSKVTAENN